jgi:hypothetical protein
MKEERHTIGRAKMRLTRSAAALLFPLLLASGACGTTAPTQALGPVLGLTLPPAWTPTAYIPPGFAEGWATLTGNGVELMLPTSYEGGDPTALTQDLLDLLDESPATASIAEAIRQNPAGYRLIAIDRSNDSIVAVTVRDAPAEVSMSEYVEAISAAIVEQIPGTSILDKGVLAFRGGEAGWLLLEFVLEEDASWQLSYGVRQGDQVWNFDYAGAREDYPQLQPIFDQSLQTIRFLP